MNDAPRTEAQQVAAALVEQHGFPQSREALEAMLVVAYASGAVAGLAEAAELDASA